MSEQLENQMFHTHNYQLDFWKLILAFLVFFGHALSDFASETTRIPKQLSTPFGYFCVHAFFVISGMLMINSIYRKNMTSDSSGKSSFDFVINKCKSLALPYVIVLILNVMIYFVLRGAGSAIPKLPNLIVELFALSQNGTYINMINGHTWFLSAMILAMLPLSYLMFKNRETYIYVFGPIIALVSMGYIFQAENHYLNQYAFCGILSGGVIRAIWGLCSGCFAWIIYKKIEKHIKSKFQVILLTIVEVVISILYFFLLISLDVDIAGKYASTILLPILFGIVFSQKSYISYLFHSKIFKYCGSLSLALYLNHWGAEVILMQYFPSRGFKFCFVLMCIITMVQCTIYYLIMHICRRVWKEKLRTLFISD